MNQFVALSAVQQRLLVTEKLTLGNEVKHVKKIMFYTNEFLEFYYERPIFVLQMALELNSVEEVARTRRIQLHELERQQQEQREREIKMQELKRENLDLQLELKEIDRKQEQKRL